VEIRLALARVEKDMFRYGALLGTLVLLAAGCGGSKTTSATEEEGGTQTTIAGVQANDHGTKTVSGTTEIELDDYYFDPTVLEGKPGQKVTFELKNEGSTEHNFTLAAQHVDQDVDQGETKTVTVTIPQSGELSFFCKYHRSRGMAGALSAT